MTRINAGIQPSELPDKLLLAECREITRIPNAVRKGTAILTSIPPQFTLGKGHVRFFYDKLSYLADRYSALYFECLKRGFKVTDRRSAFHDLPPNAVHQYHPTEADRLIVLDRIQSKGFSLLTNG